MLQSGLKVTLSRLVRMLLRRLLPSKLGKNLMVGEIWSPVSLKLSPSLAMLKTIWQRFRGPSLPVFLVE